MSNFNSLERSVAKLLTNLPMLKSFVKYSYSRMSFMLNKKAYKFKCDYEVTYYDKDCESFFGYYDCPPNSNSGNVIVCIPLSKTENRPCEKSPLSISILNKDMQQIVMSKETYSYNWQQGARAQWLNDDLFIMNEFHNETGNYRASIYSVSDNKIVNAYEFPVQTAFQDKYYISLNYERLMIYRPDYGYRNKTPLSDSELSNYTGDGLTYIDIQTGEARMLISYQEILLHEPKNEFDGASHKFNHVIISPNGTKFIFMHRFISDGVRSDRLFMFDLDTKSLTLISDFGMVSHCCWLNDNKIFGYLRGPGNIDSYWFIDIGSITFERFTALDEFGDGHPSAHGDWIITDTYPNRARMQQLILVNWKTSEIKVIAELYHGFKFSGESRCDLHPRFSRNGEQIFFDSVFSGMRRLYRLTLK